MENIDVVGYSLRILSATFPTIPVNNVDFRVPNLELSDEAADSRRRSQTITNDHRRRPDSRARDSPGPSLLLAMVLPAIPETPGPSSHLLSLLIYLLQRRLLLYLSGNSQLLQAEIFCGRAGAG